MSLSVPLGVLAGVPGRTGHRPAPAPPDAPAWAPYSPCAIACLTPSEPRAPVPLPLALLRAAGALLALLASAPVAVVYPFLRTPGRRSVLQVWFRVLLWTFGVRLDAEKPGGGAALVVSNHVSWLDILVLGAVRPGRMVARADLRRWPLLGPVSARAGTIFVDRDRLSELPRTVAEVATALRGGATVLAFPEGTTWCGVTGGKFRPALFQAAIDADVPVDPLSVRYLAGGRPSTVPAFVGDDPMVASLWRVARARGLVAEVRCHPRLAPDVDRRRLAERAGRVISG